MFKTKITLEEALEMESRGEIFLVSLHDDVSFHPNAPIWKQNYELLRKKYRHVNPEKLLTFVKSELYTEICHQIDEETYEWFQLPCIKGETIKQQTKDNIEYIYVLTNPGYPDLVKIGMTEKTVEGRVKSINATSTVHEWVAKFALPVEKGTALRVEQYVHKCFEHLRVDSDHGNEREFFRIDPLTAFDKLREIGAIFQVGNPIVY
jgi:hypothetical protein